MKFWKLLKRACCIIMLVFVFLFLYIAKIEPNWIEVVEQPISISKLPEAFKGFRIV